MTRLIFVLVFFVSFNLFAKVEPCAGPANLEKLKESGVTAHLAALLQGQEVLAGKEYVWNMTGQSPFQLRVEKEAPHRLSVFVKEQGEFVSVRELCSNGENTILRLARFNHAVGGPQDVQIDVSMQPGGRHIATVWRNRTLHRPATQVGRLTVNDILSTSVATQRPGRR